MPLGILKDTQGHSFIQDCSLTRTVYALKKSGGLKAKRMNTICTRITISGYYIYILAGLVAKAVQNVVAMK